ncbi:hypothetical protein V7S43_000877 [Phytophthora oleae]|uniref:Uncharacterized protein n=1 Tax=Phytophthora oleae TaxID=2107226 RepID=A0ABD3G712_9STRA
MAPPRRVTRRDAEEFLRRLGDRVGEERERLVQEHQAYMNGTRDSDADFGDEETKDDAPAAPPTTGRRPRMTVAAREKDGSLLWQK